MENDNNWQAKFEPCPYSTRLLDKLLVLNEQAKFELTAIKKAIYYAKIYHGKRQSGEPYYSHPLEVAYLIADYLFRTDIIITSILHDTLEDTTLTFEMIEHSFGIVIANHPS
jgi:(p)ppGpp synthase/HD superfamily hydrolase